MKNKTKKTPTPGPWIIVPKDDGGIVVGNPPKAVAIICVRKDWQEDPEAIANARLIAEAPSALDLLETMAEYMEESHHQDMVMENDGASSGAERQHKQSEPDCSYCKAIADAKALLKRNGR